MNILARLALVALFLPLLCKGRIVKNHWKKVPLAHHQRGYVSACLLTRDSHLDVRDWVEWHHWIGVEKIFLFDHNSSPPLYYEIEDYIQDGVVQYNYFRSEFPPVKDRQFNTGLQGRVFSQCFTQARDYFTWMLFTDTDEFVLVRDPQYNYNLSAFLRKHEDAGAVLMHWLYAGSGGLERRTPGMPAMTTFTMCLPELNTHVKGIAHLNYSSVGIHAHTFSFAGRRAGIRVGDNRRARNTARVYYPPADPPVVLMHYQGSEAEWRLATGKNARNRVSGGGGKPFRWNQYISDHSNTTCLEAKEAFLKMPRRSYTRPSFAPAIKPP